MFSFAAWLDLPLIWGGIIALAVFLYVLLDGFDLGVGILFPFAPTDDCRNKLMNSVAPFWDGNETWLVLGGGGLLAAFPVAYAVIMPALYIPIIFMLIALIFRGVAFEFRFKASLKVRPLWDGAFHFGSLFAALFQGIILGSLVEGLQVTDKQFAGGHWDWVAAFPILTGIALVSGYSLLGATWLILKTTGETQRWARECAAYALIYVVGFVGLVSIWMLFGHDAILARWFSWPNVAWLIPLPLGVLVLGILLAKWIQNGRELAPFLSVLGLFALNYIGLAISLWPWIVPYQVSLWDAAAADESLSLLLIGAVIMLPTILGYTAYSYYIFRGKTDSTHNY
jgi:cytochrome d ubiquinol oxidase subunit II